MALSVVEALEAEDGIDPDGLAKRFAARFAAEPERGYGLGAARVLERIAAGEDWRAAARAGWGGAGSLGNGAAMRVAPIGAFHRGDPTEAARAARRSAEITHAHPEGIAGAVAVAAATAQVGDGEPFASLDVAIAMTVHGAVHRGLVSARELPQRATADEAARVLGSGQRATAADTVPFALWCAARFFDDAEEALWQAVSVGGDRDTLGAIVGGIVALSDGATFPPEWLARGEPLSNLPGSDPMPAI